MEPSALTTTAVARICARLAEAAIDASYVTFVARHVDAADSTWRWCCGSNCDPCVERLGRVVDQTRQDLCWSPDRAPGLPAPEPGA
jgi:hypothetical protein